jgi:hypothetical protein
LRKETSEGEMVMFGGEEVGISMAVEIWVCARFTFSEARARRARAFLGFETRI